MKACWRREGEGGGGEFEISLSCFSPGGCEEVVSSKSRVPRDVAPPSVGIVGRYFLGRVVWGGGARLGSWEGVVVGRDGASSSGLW